MKTAKIQEKDVFFILPFEHVSGLTGLVSRHITRKLWAIAHENSKKTTKKMSFFVLPLKHVSELTAPVNRPRTLQLWEIAHENGQK